MPPPQLPKVGKNLYNQGLGKGANSGGRVQQPENILCCVCHRLKPQSQFSTRQLTKHKGTLYQPTGGKGGRPQHRTTCKTCTADQTTELTCIVCGETNGLDHFAKTQRKNPDTARCKNCINMQADIDPNLAVPDSDEYASSDDSEDEVDFDTGAKEHRNTNTVVRAGDTSYAASSIHSNTLTSANLNRLERATGPVITPRPGAAQAADGWVTKSRQPAPQQQLQSETMTTMTYDSAPRHGNVPQPPSSVISGDSRTPLRSIPPKPATELRKNGWAKVNKIPKKGQAQGINDMKSDDGYDDFDGSVTSSASTWTDRKKTIKTDFDDDPWSRHYK
ncbi:hypothetical protein TWF481_004816 [Arthrobotrys musiformis]|uniref:Stc1 domain-containing protein n=1 Tax=Arthrobotrys musiformis TaxID=47236 RepID=A0AAV9WRD3_9PEZI